MTVVLASQPGHAAKMERHLADLASRVPAERQHLTPEEFAEQFGPHPDALAAVQRFARNNGLHVLDDEHRPGKPTVEVTGSMARLQRAFGVRLQLVRTPHGVFRVPISRVHVPAWVAPSIEAVIGFDTRPIARPHFRFLPGGGQVPAGQFIPAASNATSFAPPEVASLYKFPKGTDGTGQTIALIELGGGYQQRDLDRYFGGLGISTPQVEAVSVNGAANAPVGNPNSADGEVLLDIEVAGSIAPGAAIAVYFAPNTDRGFVNAIQAAVHDTQRRPTVISISWGGPEESWPIPPRRLMNQAFQAAAAMGISVFVAAGDSGSSDGVAGRLAHVDFPASSPFVVGCGGTHLVADSSGIASETVWNDPGDGATGGGVSRIFPVPSFQSAINPVSVNPGHRKGRGVPDVSGDASPATGYNVLVDGQAMPVGGTSAVAPLWAALIARVQQDIGASVAPLLPGLYANPQAFNDIDSGANPAYKAGPGWDPCTGLGSPDGAALLSALSQHSAAASDGQDDAGSAGEPAGKAESADAEEANEAEKRSGGTKSDQSKSDGETRPRRSSPRSRRQPSA